MSRKLLTNVAVGLVLLVSFLSWRHPVARSQQKPDADSDAQRIEDLITACHIIANEGVVDSFGHMSVRSAKNPNRFGWNEGSRGRVRLQRQLQSRARSGGLAKRLYSLTVAMPR